MKSKIVKMKKGASIVLVALVGLSSCVFPVCITQEAQVINISGAWALYPMMVTWAEEYTKIYPDIRIDVSAGGAGKGMADTLGGLVDIGMVSREIYPEEIEKGAFSIAVVKDAVIPIFNKENPYREEVASRGLTKDMFYNLYISGNITTWGDILGRPDITDKVQVYTRSDACGAAQTWALYLGYTQEDLQGVGVYGDPGIVEAVANDKCGIGYANLNFAYDATTGTPSPGVRALPIDLNNNVTVDDFEYIYDTKTDVIQAIIAGVYPSPPARDLYMVTKGKPTGIVRDFLLWILTDGQQYIEETGYISLGARIEVELERLEE